MDALFLAMLSPGFAQAPKDCEPLPGSDQAMMNSTFGERSCIYNAILINAARENFERDTTKGSIQVGELADRVALSENLLTADPLTIDDIAVEKTILGGKVVYEVDSMNVR